MRAIIQTAPGDADTLMLGELPMPEPGPGQLRVRVRAAGINRADIAQREGRYPPPPGAPETLGLEVAGEVDAVGIGSKDFAVGDRVMALVGGGGYAEYALVDAPLAVRLPDELGFVEAATLPETWMTAWLNLIDLARLMPGETALVHAGAGGVGAAAIQLAGLVGARAIATAGTADKCTFCRQLGAELALNYRDDDVVAALKAAGRADVVLDPVGGDSLSRNLACMNPGGRLVVIAFMAGRLAELDLAQLMVKHLTLIGSTLRSRPLADKARLAGRLGDTVLPALASGRVRITLDSSFPLARAAEAHRYVEANRNLGKVVLTV
ncbi:NAD(P)H-quinone oxidoreductase [Microvirgula aerodenitrificans]|uniref:NAD(P)H-quinone oxidoreductase n=1 Tax=Microvirgula aerodenitrificans TaxID=57480 RepID=UPI0028EC7078|nr:NAD(P)H-quinone oxidoreductase [Microvirgula aerodenitrificans]